MAQAEDADRWLREGVARHARGEIAAAETLYRKVLQVRPDDANAANLLGVAARQRGDLAAALEWGARAVALRPGVGAFLANHGAALAEAGRLEEAVGTLRAALAARPDDPVVLRNLGQALCAMGDPRAALAPLERAAALQPDAAEPMLALAHARREAGDGAGAAAAAEAALVRARGDAALAAQARFLLAALGRCAPPERAPSSYVRDLFDQYAPRFEAELTGRLGYRTPEALAALLRRAGVAAEGGLRVLDLGCGTGLSGAALAPFAARLEGLDLSPRMLAEARRRGLYAALHEADLLDWLPRHPRAFDLVAAADVLNYLGDLAPALAAIGAALVPGGVAAFSVEAGPAGAPYTLGEGMRYRHDPVHVAALARAAGFSELAREAAILRRERGAPVAGVLFVLRLGGGG
ncbi:methyltransferase domain-containing protein [Caldovatus aquaticus]|uniref:Methyltransferase domain-containing protein n=1 Tax=Caldovatus aquaticus TaxID=2865671 RepID=A0ABS7F1R7_9PROT|nr:methyltransferase domain-containing protein [Caldovatus aquaticus]MBW8269550.1 methyltransferase domain-containing protein [Caldovatus aquaticus]